MGAFKDRHKGVYWENTGEWHITHPQRCHFKEEFWFVN